MRVVLFFMKKGQATDQVIKWVIALAILIVAGLAVRMIIGKFSG